MPSAKEIKDRISSVRDTQKITNAMYLIASTKMRKAKADLDRTMPYFSALRGEIKRIFRTVGNIDSQYFFPEGSQEDLPGAWATWSSPRTRASPGPTTRTPSGRPSASWTSTMTTSSS